MIKTENDGWSWQACSYLQIQSKRLAAAVLKGLNEVSMHGDKLITCT